eukprot:TRINITY_DN4184_c0_g1_i1.p2 TRINITY_DN4184_c0_g1~~TRINITY_DN4184_c0_g1_i1.p2  ORF type:complete len:102 (-),score=10.36 TRINITY_DN4184_c0_g1_i1:527-832(-)
MTISKIYQVIGVSISPYELICKILEREINNVSCTDKKIQKDLPTGVDFNSAVQFIQNNITDRSNEWIHKDWPDDFKKVDFQTIIDVLRKDINIKKKRFQLL